MSSGSSSPVAVNKKCAEELNRIFDAGLSVAALLGIALSLPLVVGYFLVIEPILGFLFHGMGSAVVCLSLAKAIYIQAGIVDSRLIVNAQTLKAPLIFVRAPHSWGWWRH